MAQQLKALAVLAEDPGSMSSTCIGAVTPGPGNLPLSCELCGHQTLTRCIHTWGQNKIINLKRMYSPFAEVDSPII